MALMKSALVTKLSGSIGGMTAANSSQGSYLRARSVPVNPSTPRQNAIRTILRTLVTNWTQVLSPAQREAWNLYGRNVSTVNRLGDTIKISGQNWYINANTARSQATLAVVNDAPTTFNRGDTGHFLDTSSLTVASGLDLTLTANLPAWVNTDDAYALIYMGKPQNGARNFFRGPWRYAGKVAGSSTAPPVDLTLDAATLAQAYTYALSNHVWFRVTAVYPDGRYAAATIYGPMAVTAGT